MAQPTSWSSSPAAASGAVAQSSAVIRYHAHAGLLGAGAWERPLERFDFMDEWNNMGYGAVRADGSIWSWQYHSSGRIRIAWPR